MFQRERAERIEPTIKFSECAKTILKGLYCRTQMTVKQGENMKKSTKKKNNV